MAKTPIISEEIRAKIEKEKEELDSDFSFINGKIEGNEVESIAAELGIGISTMYNYLGGKRKNIPTAICIRDRAIQHLALRKIYKQDHV